MRKTVLIGLLLAGGAEGAEPLCDTARETEMLAARILDGEVHLGAVDCDMLSIVCQVKMRRQWDHVTSALTLYPQAKTCKKIEKLGNRSGNWCRLTGNFLTGATYQRTAESVDDECKTNLATLAPLALEMATAQMEAYAAGQIGDAARARDDDAPEP